MFQMSCNASLSGQLLVFISYSSIKQEKNSSFPGIDRFPSHTDDLRQVKPILETLPGWEVDVSKVRRLEDLPAGARRYLDRVSELVGRPVDVVSVGPDREQTIFAGGVL